MENHLDQIKGEDAHQEYEGHYESPGSVIQVVLNVGEVVLEALVVRARVR
jgi:hypothetical protein